MVFADLLFLYFFLPVCLICYFITRNANIRNIVLIVFSMIFYAWGEPVWVSILAVSALVDYYNGRVIEKHPEGWQAKLALAWSLIFNLGLLFGFKYTGFFVENLNNAAGLNIPVPHIKLPIGISFYTFQTISYTIDCYWGKVKPQKSFLKFLMYVSLFPQLVAGPIVRYSVIAEEIEDRKTTINDISEGFSRIILGLGKKVLIANSLSTVVTSLFGDADNKYSAIDSLSVLGTWYGAILVGLWYYFDFSGYSDIAIQISFHMQDYLRILAEMAHLPEFVLPRLCAVYPDIRQKAQVRRTFPCMVPDRTLARCKLELRFLGTLLRSVHHDGNDDRQEENEENARTCGTYLYQDDNILRLRHLLFREPTQAVQVLQGTYRT